MITVVVLVKNEEMRLKRLLPTLAWADRVLVVDDNSDDESAVIAKQNGAQVYERSMKGDYASQRNAALKRVKTKWAFFVDADEEISDELKEEIVNITHRSNSADGYAIRRIDRFLGRQLSHGETGDMWLVRLGKTKAGLWQRAVHEVWRIEKTQRLGAPLYHESHKSVGDIKDSVERYARIDGDYRCEQGERWNLFEMVSYPVGKFILNYFLKLGILDGRAGFWMAVMMSYHSWLVRKRQYNLEYGVSEHVKTETIERLWQIFFWMIVMVIPLGQILRIQINTWMGVYVFEGLLLLQLILVSGVWIVDLKKREMPPYWWSFGLFATTLGISLVVGHVSFDTNWWPAVAYLLRVLFYGLYMMSLWLAYRWKWIRLPYWHVLMWIGVGLAIFGWFQYLLVPDTRWLFAYGWDEHLYRLIGTILDPGFLGLLLVLTLVIIDLKRGPRWIYWYGLVFGAMMLTYSRSVFLVYALAVMLMGWTKRSFSYLAWRIGALVIIALLLPRPASEGVRLERTYSIETRARSVMTAMDLFTDYPWTGVGFNAYRDYVLTDEHPLELPVHPSAPDSSLGLLLATAGVLGIIGFGIFVSHLLFLGRHDPILWISLLVILAHSLTNNSWFYVFVMLWVGFLFGNVRIQRKK